MKRTIIHPAAILLISAAASFGQGTAFTYQGRLNNSTNPANGSYDLRFTLYNAGVGGAQQGPILTNSAVPVSAGLFNVTLDFGTGVFTGADRWLDIAMRTNGSGAFTTLSPRQQLTATPYSTTAGNLTGVLPAASLVGTYSGAVTLNNPANSLGGNGANLTSLNAGQLASGTVADARLSSNVALRAGGNMFSGTQSNAGSLYLTAGGALYTDNGPYFEAKNTAGVYEGYLVPRWFDNGMYLNFGDGGFNLRDNYNNYYMTVQTNGAINLNGTVNVGGPETFPSTLGDKISLYGGLGGVHYGLGIAPALLQIHGNNSGSDIAFGYGQSSSFTETMRIKGNGNVGIGTPNPLASLQVVNSGSVGVFVGNRSPFGGAAFETDFTSPATHAYFAENGTGVFSVGGGGSITSGGGISAGGPLNINNPGYPGITSIIRARPGDTSPLILENSNAVNVLTVSTDGSVSIGSGSSQFNLNASYNNVTMTLRERPGDAYPLVVLDSGGNNWLQLQGGSPNTMFLYGVGADNQGNVFWNTFSDERLKQDVRPYEAGLKELLQIQTVRYRYRDDVMHGLTSAESHMGVIAQQAQQVFPEAARAGSDGYLLLNADPIFWASINAIQELNQKVEKRDTEITELKNELSQLKAVVQSMNLKLSGGAK